MGKARKDLFRYLGECLDMGLSFNEIEEALVKRGYPRRIAEGIILSYKQRSKIFKYITVFILIIMFFFSLFLSGSGIAGMVTLGHARTYVENINLALDIPCNYTWYPNTKGELMSVSLTGNIVGGGEARVILKSRDESYLVLDSGKKGISVTDITSSVLGGERIRHFNQVCEESCNLEGLNNSVYYFMFDINNSVLEITKIHYAVRTDEDAGGSPRFIEIPPQDVSIRSKLRINLTSFFNTTRKGAVFSYVNEENASDIQVNGGIAEIKPLMEGKTYVYFRARLKDEEYISNLIIINVTDDNIERRDLVTGSFISIADAGKIGKKSLEFINPFLWILILVVLVGLIFIPSYYYDAGYIASRIDRIRRRKEIFPPVKEYGKMESSLHKNDLSDMDRLEMIKSMEYKIRDIFGKIPELDMMKEFDATSDEFEGALKMDLTAAEEIYGKLRDMYMNIIDSRMRASDKKRYYQRIDKYYKRLKEAMNNNPLQSFENEPVSTSIRIVKRKEEVPASLIDFNSKMAELDEALLDKSDKAEDIYSELRQAYIKLVESDIPDSEKKKSYRTVQKYYKKLKK